MSEIVAEAVRIQYAKAYEDGWRDAVAEMIAQLRGTSTTAPEGIYRGELPDELKAWLANVESKLTS